MSELMATALGARLYETVDPATMAEIARNRQIAALDRLLMAGAAEQRPAHIVPLRSGTTG